MNSLSPSAACQVSIIVKALNEESRIAACLRSALAALEGLSGEVILADSVSTDATVAIASAMAVKVVQFSAVRDRGCGAALQLGYQYARGQYLYVLDGDMTLEPGFLQQALAYLQRHPEVAGVGGKLIDQEVRNVADKLRVAHYGALTEERSVAVLGGGGLYRADAVAQVGYLSNRWLPAFEEAELGARLLAAGWRLVRLPQPAVRHCGHDETSWQLMRRQWRSGRIEASGRFLRAAMGRAWQSQAVRACWFVFAAPLLYLSALMAGGLAVLAGGAFWPALGAGLAAAWGGAAGLLIWRKRNWHEALISVVGWHLFALGAARGFCRPAGDPREPIAARVISDKSA
ncbi:glycosyltransferase [Rugamonas sp. A1-17]|nr:glycosyltransferase [Rugamonas sp. A1-17]